MRISDWSSDVCSSDLHGLFADYAFALHRMARAAAVGDDPVPRQQLHRLRALILDPHVIGPEPAPACRLRLLGQIAHRHANDDAMRLGDIRSEEHTSELQSLMRISYAVFCFKKKQKTHITQT